MSILIPNEDMPSGCFACPMVSGYMLYREGKREPCVKAGLCRLNRKIEVQIEGRPQDCPLIEVQPPVYAKDIYMEHKGHCEFACSACGAWIGCVEGGTLDGGKFKYCPNCGAIIEAEVQDGER